jgi:6-phosphogluconolactonase (cycloisomerase 2 family)
MNLRTRLTSTVVTATMAGAFTAAAVVASPATATTPRRSSPGSGRAVFVQTDDVAGNQVVAYHRAADGSLARVASYDTGGLGGILNGAVVDHTASQGALSYDPRHSLLFAVNPGSNSVSVFAVHGDHLDLRQVVGSGGTFPVSIAVHGNLVYVLNARDGGSVRGFVVSSQRLQPIAGSTRALGLDPTAAPEFTHTPGQVTFTPDGSKLLITTKANTSAVEVFDVHAGGRASAHPVVTTFAGDVPFALVFDQHSRAVIADAGGNAAITAKVEANGRLTTIATAATGQAATCWILRVGDRVYLSNAGSATLTGYRTTHTGVLSPLGNTATDAGTVDAAASPSGHFVYVQTGKAGIVDEFHIASDGELTALGSVTVANGVGGEGIVAT